MLNMWNHVSRCGTPQTGSVRLGVPLLFVSLAFWLVGQSAFAVIGVTPLRLDVYARPGLPTPFTVQVSNTSAASRNINLIVEQIRVNDDGEATIVPQTPEEEQVKEETPPEPTQEELGYKYDPSIISIDGGNQLTLAGGETRNVTGTVNLPQGADGEYMAILVADPGPEDMPLYGNTSRRLRVTFRIGVAIFIVAGYRREVPNPDGSTNVIIERSKRPFYSAEFSDVEIRLPEPGDNPQTIKISGKLINRSTTFISPLIKAEARTRQGTRRALIEETNLNHGFGIIFSNTTRRFKGEFTAPFEPGTYSVAIEADLGLDPPNVVRAPVKTLEVKARVAGNQPTAAFILDVSPVRANIQLKPGQSSKGTIKVRNTSKEPLRVTAGVVGESAYDSWVRFSPDTFIVTPNQEKTITAWVRAPSDATIGLASMTLGIVPTRTNGTPLADTETREIEATLRIIAPKTTGAQDASPPPR